MLGKHTPPFQVLFDLGHANLAASSVLNLCQPLCTCARKDCGGQTQKRSSNIACWNCLPAGKISSSATPLAGSWIQPAPSIIYQLQGSQLQHEGRPFYFERHPQLNPFVPGVPSLFFPDPSVSWDFSPAFMAALSSLPQQLLPSKSC